MEGTKDAKAQTTDDAPAAGRTRDEQATSSKTLSDLERTQSDAAAGGAKSSGGGGAIEGSSPSPDGQADGARSGRADGSDTGGPM